MVEVLVDRDLDRKVDRIAPAARLLADRELERSRSGLDLAVAGATVLLAPVTEEDEAPLDDRDLFGVFALTHHLGELAATLRAGSLRLAQLMVAVHQRQMRLLPRAMALFLLLFFFLSGWLARRSGALLRRVAKQGPL